MRSLPLYEQVIANGTDTILIANRYASFGRTDNIQLSNQRILHKGAEMANRDFLGYDIWGNPLATSINHATPTSYLWGYNASLPIAVIKGAAITKNANLQTLVNVDSLLVTRYAYEPLVGCTSVTNPNGRTTNYAYKGGRLATITNYCGNKICSYEYTINAETEGTNMTSEQVYTSANGATNRQTTVYYDAFGHPVTTVNKNSSTEGRDLVMLTEYDALDRPTKEWQPVPMSNVSSLVNATDFSAASSSEYADSRAYIEKEYEQSLSSNVTKETPSGEAYSSHPTLTTLSGNKSSNAMFQCYRFEANGSYAFRKKGTYKDGELSVIKTTDADGRTKLTFFDWRGNKILERSVIDKNKGTKADTYYVYDALGNLCFVLPPALKSMRVTTGMTWNIHECALLRQYAYFYRYDNRGLLDDGSYSTIDYCSNLTYENKKLSTILFDGGYASVDADGNIAMHYYVKDHLGSNRLVVDGNGNIEETNHYYPFGALMGDSKNVKRNKYKYVGKELDRMYGIDMQDHGARWYDPIVGRWIVIDELSDKYYAISNYVQSLNDIINNVDIDGKKVLENKINVIYISNGRIKLSPKASPYTKMLFNGMMKTQTGRRMLCQMVNSPTAITLKYVTEKIKDKETLAYTQQTTKDGSSIRKKNGKFTSTKAKIVFNMNNIINSVYILGNSNNGYTLTEAMGAEGTHEAVHASDPEEVNIDIEQAQPSYIDTKRTKEEYEKKANETELQYRLELDNL